MFIQKFLVIIVFGVYFYRLVESGSKNGKKIAKCSNDNVLDSFSKNGTLYDIKIITKSVYESALNMMVNEYMQDEPTNRIRGKD